MLKLTEDQIAANLAKFYSYIDKYIKSPRKKKLIEFYKHREITLATSPASTKLHHHNCFAGGYIEHVNRVVDLALVLDRVWDKFGQAKDYTEDELVFCAINHDLGKLGTDEQPFYLPNDSSWHVEKQGAHFKYNPALDHMRISDRSLFYLQQAGISMNEKEYLAIKVHDGLYEEANKSYLMPYGHEFEIKSNLSHILHQADFTASRIEKQINSK